MNAFPLSNMEPQTCQLSPLTNPSAPAKLLLTTSKTPRLKIVMPPYNKPNPVAPKRSVAQKYAAKVKARYAAAIQKPDPRLNFYKGLIDPRIPLHRSLRPEDKAVSINHIIDGIYIGNVGAACDPATLKEFDITAVISTTTKYFPEFLDSTYAHVHPQRHAWYQIEDIPNQDILGHFKEVCAFIHAMRFNLLDNSDWVDTHIKWPLQKISASSPNNAPQNILIHCRKGISRSVSFLMAYLMVTHDWNLKQAYGAVRDKRKVNPNIGFCEQLYKFQRRWKKDTTTQYYSLPERKTSHCPLSTISPIPSPGTKRETFISY
jgi:dual specificity protein phosphatase-like protein